MSRRDYVEAVADGAPSIGKIMAAYSLDAVDHAASIGVNLDYSEASLQDVEAILDQLCQARPRGLARLFRSGPSEEDMATFAKMYGGYVGEVMRLEWGEGDWLLPEDGPFAGWYVLSYGTMTSPPAKVVKRLTEGPGDNIWSYYRVLKSGFLEGSS